MTVDILSNVLLWSFVINFGFLCLWGFVFILARNFVYKKHCKIFKISEEQFNAIHYTGIIFYKLIISFFTIIPYIALKIAT